MLIYVYDRFAICDQCIFTKYVLGCLLQYGSIHLDLSASLFHLCYLLAFRNPPSQTQPAAACIFTSRASGNIGGIRYFNSMIYTCITEYDVAFV
jgi:hypothetical protein